MICEKCKSKNTISTHTREHNNSFIVCRDCRHCNNPNISKKDIDVLLYAFNDDNINKIVKGGE